MSGTLIGLCNNVVSNGHKIGRWVKSFKKVSDGKVVLLCANTSDADVEWCKTTFGIDAVAVSIADTHYINHQRLLATKEYLADSTDDIFLVTDVFDVMFQSDPFAKLDFSSSDIFVSGEGVLVSQEPWNSDNISKLFPDHTHICRMMEVINSGVIAGKREALIELLGNMYVLCELAPKAHNIKDQAALIVLLAWKIVPNVRILNLDDGWAMHCAVAGPTQFFDSWGFRRAIRYRIPSMVNGKVCTGDTPYAIVHQFNRVPEWQAILEATL